MDGWVNGPVKEPLNFTGNLVIGADLFFILYVQDCFALAEVCTHWSTILVLHWISFQLEARPKRETNRAGARTDLSNGHEGV